ncbi:hypothetical protein YC2023_084171 [Brassica napus]
MRADTQSPVWLDITGQSMVDSEDRYSTEKASSVQSMIIYDCDAEALPKSIRPSQSYSLMIKWRCCPELVQFHGFRSVEVLLDTPLGSPENCPKARGGSVRVQISLSRPVSFFMVKPSPVHSNQDVHLGFFPSLLRSTSCLSTKNALSYNQLIPELFSRGIPLLGSWIMAGGQAYWGELVFLQTSYPAGSRKPLIRWIGKTQIDGVMAYG